MASTSDRIAEDKRLLARVDDACERCRRFYAQCYIGFLDERCASLVASHLTKHATDLLWSLYGGHEEAERVYLIVSSYEELVLEEAPLCAMEFRWRDHVSLSHRDILGSLIGCGIARDKIGDILCENGRAVAFVQTELASFIKDTLTTIGREGVTVNTSFEGPLPIFHRYRELSGTIASVRLDAVLKVLLGISREQASELIRQSLVQVNHSEVSSVSMAPKQGDRVSVRGYGRYVIDDLSETTKKGRLILRARQFV